ncbi:MAG: hypothetical protein AB7O28_14025 [Vicinamibacterales bacterium]
MARIVADQPGVRLALDDPRWSLRIDRPGGVLDCAQQPLIGRARERRLDLDRIRAVECEVPDLPPISLDVVTDLFKRLISTPNPAARDPHETLSQLPRTALVRIFEDGARGRDCLELRVTLEQPSPTASPDAATAAYVRLAFHLAAAIGLPYAAVSVLPHIGTYVDLTRERSRDAVDVPAGEEASGGGLERAAEAARRLARVPPFDPGRFSADHRVVTWKPSSRVEFHRRLSILAWFVLPFTLLVLTGPVLLGISTYTGLPLDGLWLAGGSVFGLASGGVALLLLSFLMPRSLVVDWTAGTIAIRSWPRAESIAMTDLVRLDLEGEHHTSSGGESGTDSTTYRCTLFAVHRGPDGNVRRQELVATTSMTDVNEPYRQAVPLVTDLAGALHVEGRVLEYAFRRKAT